MTTVHFVYPHGPSISCPDAIGRNVGARLRQRYEVVQYDWDETTPIHPGPNDVLLGHPHPAPWTCFRRSIRYKGWRRIIALSPFNHDLRQVAFLDSVIARCDLYLAITGSYWYQATPRSKLSHWWPKMVHVDLAIDRADYPAIKARFNPAGRRRFVYIGHSGWTKNTPYLAEIAGRMPETAISWMGSGPASIPGLVALGRQDFRTDAARRLVASHDFLITVGKADANPSTILEAMAWGLIPVCTRQSGYSGYAGIVNIPIGDPESAVKVLRELQVAPESLLRDMQTANWRVLEEHFNWDRFAGQVIDAIESDRSPMLGSRSRPRAVALRLVSWLSPYAWWRRSNLRLCVQALSHAGSGGRRDFGCL